MAKCSSYREGDVIHIGNDITISIIYVSGSALRMSIDAPREVTIRQGKPLDKTHPRHDNAVDDRGNPRYAGKRGPTTWPVDS